MRAKFFQENSSRWKPGLSRPIASLRLSPKALERTLDLKFEEEEDDLDRFQVAFLKTPEGDEFALVRYLHSPASDTEIWTNSLSRQPRTDLKKALEVLGLGTKILSWTHPDLSKSSTSGARNPIPAERKARVGRNPATGEEIRIPAKRIVRFRRAAGGTLSHSGRRRPVDSVKKK